MEAAILFFCFVSVSSAYYVFKSLLIAKKLNENIHYKIEDLYKRTDFLRVRLDGCRHEVSNLNNMLLGGEIPVEVCTAHDSKIDSLGKYVEELDKKIAELSRF